jgi:hypothetical protein
VRSGLANSIQVLLVAVGFAVPVALAVPAAQSAQPVAGWGSLPLGSTITALWLTGPEPAPVAAGAPAPAPPPPLVFAFYVGPEGWHEREWKSDVKVLAGEGSARLVGGDIVLTLAAEPAQRSVTVQGQRFDLSAANVFVVSRFLGRDRQAAEAGKVRVQPLGLYALADLTGDEPAAAAFLRKHPQAGERLVAALRESEAAEQAASPLIAALTGTWGMEGEGVSCKDNPHTIQFSPDVREMTLQFTKSFDANPPTRSVYDVRGEGAGFLHMTLRGEDRKTDAGKLVEWDLVLLDADRYCWHRSDWREGGCTQPATRCAQSAS